MPTSDFPIPSARIQAFRDALPAFGILQVNTGTKGICAPSVVEALLERTREIEAGGYGAYARQQRDAAAARARLATFFGADVSELAFTGNATESLNAALALPWDRWGTPVDVLISDHEYPTTNMVFGFLKQTGRVNLIRYPLETDTQALLDGVEGRVTSHTRVLVASHVDCNKGRRIDVAALSRWARERGIVSFIDGAQAAGQFPIDLHAMGCDVYVTNGHKWLYGPNGVGLLYVRAGFEDEMLPSCVGSGTMHFSPTHEYDGPPSWMAGAHRFELTATRPAQVLATMDAAMDAYESWGPGVIESQQRAIADHLRWRILEQPDRFTLLSPDSWEHGSALVSIGIHGVGGQQIGEFCGRMLEEGKGFLRPVPEFDALRISAAYYNTVDDYERLFDLLSELEKESGK